MKLTDEKVAKALGWKRVKPDPAYPKHRWQMPHIPAGKEGGWTLPPFTTSLDAIVAEYMARGIRVVCSYDHTGAWAEADGGKRRYSIGTHSNALTLALCAALLSFLKEKP